MIYKGSRKKIVWLLLAIILGFFVYKTYTFFTSDDSFIKQEFKEVTGVNLPKSAKILNVETSSSSRGNFCTAALIELGTNDYISLLHTLKTSDKLNDSIEFGSIELTRIQNKVRNQSISFKFTKELLTRKYYLIEFYSDKKTVIIENIWF